MTVGQKEKITQERVIKLFKAELGYKVLGNLKDREDNSNIDEALLNRFLKKNGVSDVLIHSSISELHKATEDGENLYQRNKAVYEKLRYGVKVKENVGDNYETVYLINWNEPAKNHFAIAEEVTIKGEKEKRPDIVLYINGIAIGVLELKRSTVSIGEGIRQNITNQQEKYIQSFFTTIQFVFAGSDTEGLRYGTIGTGEKYFLEWKEDVADNSRLSLDKYLLKMCNKERIIELMYDFILFDSGVKKLPRVHQYFGIKAAQEHVKIKQGGIIWHTQGSGKSIVMVLLAKWILEFNPNARIVIITDRDELDKQIERVFNDSNEKIVRTKSGLDLMNRLSSPQPRILCSLIHKFGKKDLDMKEFIAELKKNPPITHGEIFVFVDECHRTQGGDLHDAMRAVLKDAVFIGFTGTPLLRKDKKTSLKVFGNSPISKSPYIHTYKFNEAVEDKVVLDLVYEARDIDQKLNAQDKVDQWFEAKTKGLNDYKKALLKKTWGTIQNIFSSKPRIEKIVQDIVFDFSTKPRLSSERGNAILVASSIYTACRYYEFFQKTELKNKVALITSYDPNSKDLVTEETGANTETEKQWIYNTYIDILKGDSKGDNRKWKSTEVYEDNAKKLFREEAINMKLLIVVDKLLTGFDAPPCSYLYLDRSLQDHGLFQAICRTNRLDGEDKDFGYIVDYKDLFRKVKGAISVYTSDLDDSLTGKEEGIDVKDRLTIGKERLDNAVEAMEELLVPVTPPKETIECIQYFCGNTEIPENLKEREHLRTTLYSSVANFVRSYVNISNELEDAGYTQKQIEELKQKRDRYIAIRAEIKQASGEELDLKPYEADMRNLLDMYIQAEDSKVVSKFDNKSLLEVIQILGIHEAVKTLPTSIQKNKAAVAESIENNVRSKIIKDYAIDPEFYKKLSLLLDTLIKERKTDAINYEKYLEGIKKIIDKMNSGKSDNTPSSLNTPSKVALYNNLNKDEQLALEIDSAVRSVIQDGFRGNPAKERIIQGKMFEILKDENEVKRIFEIIVNQSEY